MGVRKIRLCKSCGRKFTPKNQKPEQVEEIKTEAAQNDVAAVVAPEDTVTVDDQESEMSGMQLSEQ